METEGVAQFAPYPPTRSRSVAFQGMLSVFSVYSHANWTQRVYLPCKKIHKTEKTEQTVITLKRSVSLAGPKSGPCLAVPPLILNVSPL